MPRRLRQLLSEIVPSEILRHVYNSYDIIGDIAIMRLNDKTEEYCSSLAHAVMEAQAHKQVRTVSAQTGAVQGTFRLRKLKFVAGEHKTTMVHTEFGCQFLVDVEGCYFSPRLSNERRCVASQVKINETVINMFADAGCFSVLMAKRSNPEKVYSIDITPVAVQCMRENVRINGLYGVVIPMLGDATRVIEEKLSHVADRVLMPLPEKALGVFASCIVGSKAVWRLDTLLRFRTCCAGQRFCAEG